MKPYGFPSIRKSIQQSVEFDSQIRSTVELLRIVPSIHEGATLTISRLEARNMTEKRTLRLSEISVLT